MQRKWKLHGLRRVRGRCALIARWRQRVFPSTIHGDGHAWPLSARVITRAHFPETVRVWFSQSSALGSDPQPLLRQRQSDEQGEEGAGRVSYPGVRPGAVSSGPSQAADEGTSQAALHVESASLRLPSPALFFSLRYGRVYKDAATGMLTTSFAVHRLPKTPPHHSFPSLPFNADTCVMRKTRRRSILKQLC